jgi:hypothetical protein
MTDSKAKNKSVSLRIPEPLLDAAAMMGEDLHIDRSKVLNEWLYQGAEDALVALLERGKISKGYAVKVLDTTYHDLNDLLEARGIRLGPSEEQVKESSGTARLLKPRTDT